MKPTPWEESAANDYIEHLEQTIAYLEAILYDSSQYAMLVYQAGIANVFAVDCLNMVDYGREARRLLQGTFTQCETFVRGMATMGCVVRTAACNQAGDIVSARWSEDLDDQPFSDDFRPVTKG